MEPVIPKDLPLGLPAPFWLLEFLLLLSFALHILFVNLMLGGSLMVLITEIRGLRMPDWDRVSHEIAKTITVNKSLAVVLGVAPLLSISVLYTMQFYTANALTGHVWMLIVPLLIAAFLLSYAHKYSWDRLAHSKGVHLTFAGGATALFLFLPLIFLSNVNLMLYPEHWRSIGSFWDALTLANVLPRYLHFLAASFALTGLFLAVYFGRERFFVSLELQSLRREQLVRSFYGIAFGSTLAQFVLGPLLFLTLPAHTISTTLVVILTVAVLPLGGLAVWWLWREVQATSPGRRLISIVAALTAVISFMVYARHDVRETALAPHRDLMKARTAEYLADVRAAQDYLIMPAGLGGKPLSVGAQLFQRKCASCHALDTRLVGPPLVEAARNYAGNPEGIILWALKPGRNRTDYPPMPAQEMARDDLLQIASHILKTTGNL